MPQNDQQVPAKFAGWDKLFVKQGEPIPPGWTNMVSTGTDKPSTAPTPSVATGFGGGGGGIPADEPTQKMLSQDGQLFEVAKDKVEHAIKAGFFRAVHMISPDGRQGSGR